MLVITGTVAYDYIMNFPGLFEDHISRDKIHKINLSFIVNQFAKKRGGTAGNIAYTLNLLGTHHILLTAAGHDFSDYKKHFEKLGVSTQYIKIFQKEHTASGFAMTDRANNQIWGYFYGASEFSDQLKLSLIKEKIELVLIGPCGAAGSMHMASECVKKKIPYMFDPGFILTQVSDDDLTYGVEHATYLIGNDYEIDSIKRRVKQFDKLTKNKIVITTLGKEGAEVSDRGKDFQIYAAKPSKVIDPTGAGDAWRAGFLAGFERGFDIKICAQMGSVAASYAIEQYGSQEHVFTKEVFEKRYRETYNKSIKV